MDYTKKHRENTHSLLMEKWGYGKKDEAIGTTTFRQDVRRRF